MQVKRIYHHQQRVKQAKHRRHLSALRKPRGRGSSFWSKIHHGDCGHHTSSRAIAAKELRHGFYWPTALKDAEEMVKACNGCQHFGQLKHTPSAALNTIPITWPF